MKKLVLMCAALVAVACKPDATNTAKTPDAPVEVKAKVPVELAYTAASPELKKDLARAVESLDNVRIAEATEQLKQLVAADPSCIEAKALLGQITPGAEGTKLVDEAVAASAKLPEPERLRIQAIQAQRQGDGAKSLGLLTKHAELQMDAWRAHFLLGDRLMGMGKYSDAAATMQRATELNPKAGPAWNTLGYALMKQEKYDESIAAFTRYTEVSPTEPNPHDSLAEALLAAGRFEDAEKSFAKAAEVAPNFATAWQGVAFSRFFRGDFSGGREALAKFRAGSVRPQDKLDADAIAAWSIFAEGKTADALAKVAELDKEAAAQKSDFFGPYATLLTAIFQEESGKHADALKNVATVLTRVDGAAGLPAGEAKWLRRHAWLVKANAEARSGKKADAEKSVALLAESAKADATSVGAKDLVLIAMGNVALAAKDGKAAVAEFSKCEVDNTWCRLQLALALDATGDKAGADAARAKVLKANQREAEYLYIRSKVAGAASAPTKGT